MLKFDTTLVIDGKEFLVTVQEMEAHKSDGSIYYFIHHDNILIGVISVDGHCTFEVVEGNYNVNQLQPVCSVIRQHKKVPNSIPSNN
ncbi:hypothetical protein [Desertivirga arenae]|uniref:hypothetical protein n=1 Tax=Desertivirga arenae TaxID=2810309 RepID=UPI001A9683B8|nr:hypothetical protein [Pedobacter sp. SYSU D00823]